jgi:hypothetical protein
MEAEGRTREKCGEKGRPNDKTSIFETLDLLDICLSSSERMMGLEPTTSCMATRPDTPTLVQQAHG